MKITFLSVGKDRSGLFSPGVEEYVRRIDRWSKTRLLEIPHSRASGELGKEAEGLAILGKLQSRDVLVALDERGKTLSSADFAKWLGRQQDSGRDLAFAVGGDEGLGDAVRQRAELVLSLSAMTLPHRLARLVLAEQVYRGLSILRGEPYHKV